MAIASTQQLLKPDQLRVEELGPNYSRLIIEPLESGFGYTLGNSLRRILLSAIAGSAIVEVRIEGVLHEYSTIPGVKEDVLDILMNLKEVAVALQGREQAKMRLSGSGEKVLTAGDIEVPQGVTIANPDKVIATLNKDGKFSAELLAKRGYGYVPAKRVESSQEEDGDEVRREIGVLYLDASFAPLLRVEMSVEAMRVEQRTDLDRLVFELKTDGSIEPLEVMREAGATLASQLDVLLTAEVKSKDAQHDLYKEIDPKFLASVETLELKLRTINTLKASKIFSVGALARTTEESLLSTPSFGKRSVEEIKEALALKDLELGMEIDNWPDEDFLEQK